MEQSDKSKFLKELIKLLGPEEKLDNAPREETLLEVCQQLEAINKRLETIEGNFLIQPIQQLRPHPSQERFQIAEANEIVLPNTNEKACRFEPDKPCDYCSMCSSLGF